MNGDPSLIDMPKMDRSSLSCESSSKEGVILIEEFGSFHDKLQTPTLLPLWWTSQGCQLPPEASPQCFTSSSSRASRALNSYSSLVVVVEDEGEEAGGKQTEARASEAPVLILD